jgi:hypothetical protein
MLPAARASSIASGTRAVNRRRFLCVKLNITTSASNIIKEFLRIGGVPGGRNGATRRKLFLGVNLLLAVVATVSMLEVPAVTVVEANVHVESGGQPARLKLTCPESGGASVLIVNVIEEPAVMVARLGEAARPAGVGPLKLKTVLPPHSLANEPAGGHCVVSKTLTMK